MNEIIRNLIARCIDTAREEEGEEVRMSVTDKIRWQAVSEKQLKANGKC